MQAFELVLIAAAILVVSAVLAADYRHRSGTDRHLPKLMLGIVPGLVGAVLILAPRVDLIPDQNENDAWIVAAILITAVAAVGTVYRLARR